MNRGERLAHDLEKLSMHGASLAPDTVPYSQ